MPPKDAKIASNPAAAGTSWERWLWLLIPLACLAAYANSFNGPFIFDDGDAIVRNASIRSLSTALFPPHDLPVSGRPVASLSFALNYALHGLKVTGYHVVNVGLHLGCGLLLYQVLRRAIRGISSPGASEAAMPVALIATLLWLLHPLLTDAVTYITQRTELLVSFFLLQTIYFTARAADATEKSNGRIWCVAAVAACGLGMLSKEIMVAAPLLALFYDRAFLAGSFKKALKARWGMYLALALTWSLLLSMVLSNPRGESVGLNFAPFTPWQYFVTQFGVVSHYLRLVFWPNPLILDYEDWPIANSILQVWPNVLLLILLAGAGLYAFVRNHWAGFWAAWFFAILAPTSSILVIASETAAERRMYLPSAATVIIVVLGAFVLLRRMAPNAQRVITRALAVGGAAACVALGVATISRNAAYASDFGIWEDALAKRPNNTRAMLNLCTLHRDRATGGGAYKPKPGDQDWKTAHELAERAIRVLPENGKAYQILAHLHLTDGRKDEALAEYQEAVRLRPEQLDSREQIIVLTMEKGRTEDARRQIEDTLRYWPDDYIALRSLGFLRAQAGDIAEATRLFRKSLRGANATQQIEGRLNIAVGCEKLGQKAEAVAVLNEILRIDPNNADARRLLQQFAPQPTAP